VKRKSIAVRGERRGVSPPVGASFGLKSARIALHLRNHPAEVQTLTRFRLATTANGKPNCACVNDA
jgi:hypothetical protein